MPEFCLKHHENSYTLKIYTLNDFETDWNKTAKKDYHSNS